MLATGYMRSKLMLVTSFQSDFQVYELPIEALDTANHQLVLYKAKSVPLKEKWPKLFKNDNFSIFHKTPPESTFAVFAENDQGDHLLLFSYTKRLLRQVTYSFANDTVTSEPLTSSYEWSFMPSSGPQPTTVHLLSKHDSLWVITQLDSLDHLEDKYKNQSLALCKRGSVIYFFDHNNTKKCPKNVDWPQMKGIKANGSKWFYLFGAESVYYFNFTTIQIGQATTLESKLNTEFFKCSKGQETTTEITNGSTNSSSNSTAASTKSYDIDTLTLASIILIGAILILIAAITVYCFFSKRKNTSSELRRKSSSSIQSIDSEH